MWTIKIKSKDKKAGGHFYILEIWNEYGYKGIAGRAKNHDDALKKAQVQHDKIVEKYNTVPEIRWI